ncbi:cyclin-domain-containing protein [Parasitella parasitica]|nr:cyclin-domain-containing protein [Parasitella parasitica]
MTPQTIVPPAVGSVAQLNDKYSNIATVAAINPNLISLLMRHAIQTELETKRKQHFYEQQKSYVSALVDVTVQVIASIWPTSISAPSTGNNKPIADLNTFLHHILKHSRTTHSTLQLAIFYLFRIRSRVQEKRNDDVYISCGRRMFLAALISAHKYLQDKTYKNSAWSKVSGLSVHEINHAEKIMLQLLDYRLYVKKDTYDQWIMMLQTHLNVNPNGAIMPAAATTSTTTPTAYNGNINTTTAHHLSQFQQARHALLRKAQESLPSPPLEESFMPESSSQKRKNSCSLEDQEDKRVTKRRC